MTEFFGSRQSLLDSAELKLTPDGTCGLLRAEENGRIVKTAIFVQYPGIETAVYSDNWSAVSCINRGHYYHIGYSNIIDLPVGNFVVESEENHNLRMNSKHSMPLPWNLIGIQNKALDRLTALRLIAERISLK